MTGNGWGNFRKGFRSNRWATIGLALCLTVVTLYGLERYVHSNHFFENVSERLVFERSDPSPLLDKRIAAAKGASQSPVLLLGGSSVREAVESGPHLARLLSSAGMNNQAFVLASPAQTLAESIRIVEGVGRRALVVVGMNPFRVSIPPKINEKRGFKPLLYDYSSELERFFGRRVPWFSRQKNQRVILKTAALLRHNREGLAFFRSWKKYRIRDHLFDDRPPALPKHRRKWVAQVRGKFIPRIKRNLNHNLELLGVLAQTVRKQGGDLVLLEMPMSPIGFPYYRPILPFYRNSVKGFAKKINVPYLEFGCRLGLAPEDFFDFSHLLHSGREKFEPALARRLASVFRR